jgi:hypothetical protein
MANAGRQPVQGNSGPVPRWERPVYEGAVNVLIVRACVTRTGGEDISADSF